MPLPPARRKWLLALVALGALGIVLLGFRPRPVGVEVATVGRGPLVVSIDEDGETRAHDRYVISAPVAGRIGRIELHEGDVVRSGQPVTHLGPMPLSAREREEQQARVAAADALLREAQERVQRAETNHAQARRERARVEALLRDGLISAQQAEQAQVTEQTSDNELRAARFHAKSARADLEAARAGLLSAGDTRNATVLVPVRSPVDGRVLRIPDRSERVVATGEALVVVGDPARMEVVIDVLSSEAVSVQAGMAVELTGWGGDRILQARVRAVEPLAFTKVSALGVDEQRVNVIADFVDPPAPLGDAFRVEARIIVWRGDDVLKAPASALFRRGDAWSVFVVEGGRARRRDVTAGHRNALEVEILAGLEPGARVIRHPANDVEDGGRVRVQ